MRFASGRCRFGIRPGWRPTGFRRLRDQRWNKYALWRYLLLLILVFLLLKFLHSFISGP